MEYIHFASPNDNPDDKKSQWRNSLAFFDKENPSAKIQKAISKI
jgi:hypothetical protein